MNKFQLLEAKLKEQQNINFEIAELMVIRNLAKQLNEGLISLDHDLFGAELDDSILNKGEICIPGEWSSIEERLVYSCTNKISNREEKLALVKNELDIIRGADDETG